MDAADQITATAEDRGAGGKLRKPPPRRPPASPYARPAPRRWISKLVDPAYRVIAGGATRFLPSFFSTTVPASASAALRLPDPTSSSSSPDQVCKGQTGEQGDKDNTLKSDLQLLASESIEYRQDEKGKQSEKNRLSDVEQLLQRKKLSRDEFNHLVEVLNSRVMDPAIDEHGKENTNLTTGKDDGKLAMASMLPKVSSEQRHQELNGAIPVGSSPLGFSKVRDDIGASPIELARAYMDSRASDAGLNSKSMFDTVKSTTLYCDEAAIKPHDLSPSKKSSTCWPGAMVQDAYLTPQSQRKGYGLHNLRRTPYSRSLWTNSKSKSVYAQVEDGHFSSTPLHQSETTPYPQTKDKSKVDALGSGYGSVGPIRSTRRKFGVQSTSRRPAYSSLSIPSQRESSGVIEGFTPTVTKSTDADGMGNNHKPLGFKGGVPMHTSLMAKKILEHIDRSVPTPKEKSAELNLATKWKNPESLVNFKTTFSNEENGLVKSKDHSPYKYDGPDGKKYTLKDDCEGNNNVDIQPRERNDKSIDIRKEGTLASDKNVCSNIPRHGNDARTGDSQTSSMRASEEEALMTLPRVNEEKMPLTSSAASKPVLAPITVKKPVSRWTSGSDNGSGFTFPVSASSSVFLEPPTPSIMPLFSAAGDQHQSKEGSSVLSYSFGSKKSGPAVVFSFPSTSNTIHNGIGDIKFNFGSPEKARLSFSFGKNAVCC
ncbi:nuclear pore complex protein NUP1 [Lotus japonicus]|uniref:nuclear pore complex protein NUP1 n=1 Tax=Lotus japonicus TaxID=34305 RepID=UPI0025864F0C|nr:nuclear pore complex protein NUP1 [Lotus japonicus]